MRHFVSLLVGLSFAWFGSSAAAQVPDGWPEQFGEDLRTRIAERWSVGAESVELEWGVARAQAPTAVATLELVGSGRGGHWVVRATDYDGTTSTTRLRSGLRTSRPVAVRRLDRGDRLEDGDIAMRDTVVWRLSDLEETGPSVGWVVQRPIAIGEVLAQPAVRPPLAVESGHVVEVVFSSGTVAVRLSGTAAGSGVVGQEIFVRTESGTRLRGTIIAPGSVQITNTASRAVPGGKS